MIKHLHDVEHGDRALTSHSLRAANQIRQATAKERDSLIDEERQNGWCLSKRPSPREHLAILRECSDVQISNTN